MVLRLASDEVQEVHRALTARYAEVLHEMSRAEGYFSSTRGQELCRRKWKLEALLHQLDHSEAPPPMLEFASPDRGEIVYKEAA